MNEEEYDRKVDEDVEARLYALMRDPVRYAVRGGYGQSGDFSKSGLEAIAFQLGRIATSLEVIEGKIGNGP